VLLFDVEPSLNVPKPVGHADVPPSRNVAPSWTSNLVAALPAMAKPPLSSLPPVSTRRLPVTFAAVTGLDSVAPLAFEFDTDRLPYAPAVK